MEISSCTSVKPEHKPITKSYNCVRIVPARPTGNVYPILLVRYKRTNEYRNKGELLQLFRFAYLRPWVFNLISLATPYLKRRCESLSTYGFSL